MSVLFYLFYRKVSYFEGQIKAFIIPEDDKTPSALAKSLEVASDMVARSIMAQGKSFLMGLQSGQKRGENAVEADIAEGQRGNPLIGLVSSFPALKKTLRRNPALLDMALGFLARKQSAPVLSGGNGGQSEQVKFKL
jgi:hypothetical protein